MHHAKQTRFSPGQACTVTHRSVGGHICLGTRGRRPMKSTNAETCLKQEKQEKRFPGTRSRLLLRRLLASRANGLSQRKQLYHTGSAPTRPISSDPVSLVSASSTNTSSDTPAAAGTTSTRQAGVALGGTPETFSAVERRARRVASESATSFVCSP